MDPMVAGMIISAVKDIIITVGAESINESPEEYAKKIAELQPKADNLEEWLKSNLTGKFPLKGLILKD